MSRLQQLTERLGELRQHLLPAALDATGLYENEDQVATAALAYRVMAHAEIEAYFEDRVLEATSAARKAWLERGEVSRIALCILAFSGKTMSLPPDSLEAPTTNKAKAWPELIDVSVRLRDAFATFYNQIRNENHGVRERNLLAMLLPVGIAHTNLDPMFLAEIDSFGSLRGAAAHSSSSRNVRQQVDPREELQRVEGLLGGIRAIDAQIDALVSSINSSVTSNLNGSLSASTVTSAAALPVDPDPLGPNEQSQGPVLAGQADEAVGSARPSELAGAAGTAHIEPT